MTGVYSEMPQSFPGPLVIAREPATTTASPGITRGSSSPALWTVCRTRSYTGVERLRMVPVPSTARFWTTVPSYTPQLPPTSTSSSTITGSAPTGSSTPPICDAAEMWQFLPICAQLPISACESTIVPSPTYAPVLMYMGGMQVTPLPTKEPSRTLDPPGTMRMPLCAVMRFAGYVDLSKNGWRVASIDISTTTPI